MPEKKENKRQIVNSDGMKGAMKKALSTVGNTMTSPTLPERTGGESSTYYPFPASTPVLGNIGIPSFGSMYDSIRDSSSPMAMAAMAMPMMGRGSINRNVPAATSQEMPVSSLPPDLVPMGGEAAFNSPRPNPVQTGPTDQMLYNLARKKFGMGMDLPKPQTAGGPWWTNYRGQ